MATRTRTLVLIEPGRAGDAAVAEARILARRTATELTVVGLAPQASGPRCGTSTLDYNTAIVAAVADDLARVRERLASDGVVTACHLLLEGRDPALEHFAATREFDLILLPSRRRRFGPARHPAAPRLAAGIRAEVRIVDPRRPPAARDQVSLSRT